MKSFRKVIVSAVFVLGVSSMAQAQTATDDMGVSLDVAAECTLATTALAFPDAGIIVAAVDAEATVTVQCTQGAAYTIGLSVGAGAGATAGNRVLTNGDGDVANYMIYQDAAHTVPWGDVAGTMVVSDPVDGATGADELITAYGSVLAGQNVPAGTYVDTVVATITY